VASDDTRFRGTGFVTAVLIVLLVVSAALLVQAILITINYKPHNWPGWITRHAFLDTDAAIALIVGLVTVLGVIWEFKQGLRPILNHSRGETPDSVNGKMIIDVEVENSGLGPAIISKAQYELHRRGEQNLQHYSDIGGLREALEKLGYGSNRYVVCGFAPGTSIRKEGTREVAHLPRDIVNGVEEINLVLTFRSVFGGKYTERIECLPRGVRIESVPPGWYQFPDAPGSVAWWDGNNWDQTTVRPEAVGTT
jgi:hypothetical protein